MYYLSLSHSRELSGLHLQYCPVNDLAMLRLTNGQPIIKNMSLIWIWHENHLALVDKRWELVLSQVFSGVKLPHLMLPHIYACVVQICNMELLPLGSAPVFVLLLLSLNGETIEQ